MKKYKQIGLEEFDVKLLKAAAREGRLYIDVVETKKEVNKEKLVEEVRAYVARIKVFVTKAFSSSIDKIWELILANDVFVNYLTPGRNVQKCQVFNKYNVMRIICVLRENGVYEDYSGRKYDALLEPDLKDSPYRKYLYKGIEPRERIIEIRKIIVSCKL